MTDRGPRPAPDRPAPAAAGRPEDAPAGSDRGTPPRQFPGEVRGPKGPEPTRFGDWEKAGRCTDF